MKHIVIITGLVVILLSCMTTVIATTVEEDILLYRTNSTLWEPSQSLQVDDVVYYDEQFYIVIQAHTTQTGWEPPKVPALFNEYDYGVLGTIPYFRQPTGAHDAYPAGFKVRYDGYIFESLIDDNVWSPDDAPSLWEQLQKDIDLESVPTTIIDDSTRMYNGHVGIEKSSSTVVTNPQFVWQQISIDDYDQDVFTVVMYVGTHGKPYDIYRHDNPDADRLTVKTEGKKIESVVSNDGFISYETTSFSIQIASIPDVTLSYNEKQVLNLSEYFQFQGQPQMRVDFYDPINMSDVNLSCSGSCTTPYNESFLVHEFAEGGQFKLNLTSYNQSMSTIIQVRAIDSVSTQTDFFNFTILSPVTDIAPNTTNPLNTLSRTCPTGQGFWLLLFIIVILGFLIFLGFLLHPIFMMLGSIGLLFYSVYTITQCSYVFGMLLAFVAIIFFVLSLVAKTWGVQA